MVVDFEAQFEKRVSFIQKNIGCTEAEARIIAEMALPTVEEAKKVLGLNESKPVDTPELGAVASEKAATPKVSKSKVQEEDLTALAEIIKANFAEASFANKDLAPFLSELGLTARQTPSRLKKLTEMGLLIDEGGSPKKYKLS